MAESYRDLVRRLKREGRLDDIRPLLNQKIADCVAAGGTRHQALDAVAEWASQEYPPLPPLPSLPDLLFGSPASRAPLKKLVEAREKEKKREKEIAAESDEPGGVEESGESPQVSSSPIPSDWYDLPETAPLPVEVEWVHQNRVFVVEERHNGKIVLHYDRARQKPPSGGAINLMQYAATNRKGFMDILQKVKPGGAGDEENIRREKRSVAEIEELLQRMAETPA